MTQEREWKKVKKGKSELQQRYRRDLKHVTLYPHLLQAWQAWAQSSFWWYKGRCLTATNQHLLPATDKCIYFRTSSIRFSVTLLSEDFDDEHEILPIWCNKRVCNNKCIILCKEHIKTVINSVSMWQKHINTVLSINVYLH